MAIKVVYDMSAAAGQGDAFSRALADLAAAVRPLPGCIGVDILRKQDTAEQFLFVESWQSNDAYSNAAQHLPKTAFDPIKALLAGPPARSVYDLA